MHNIDKKLDNLFEELNLNEDTVKKIKENIILDNDSLNISSIEIPYYEMFNHPFKRNFHVNFFGEAQGLTYDPILKGKNKISIKLNKKKEKLYDKNGEIKKNIIDDLKNQILK